LFETCHTVSARNCRFIIKNKAKTIKTPKNNNRGIAFFNLPYFLSSCQTIDSFITG